MAKQEWNNIRIDGGEAKAKTVFGIIQFKRWESAIGLKKLLAMRVPHERSTKGNTNGMLPIFSKGRGIIFRETFCRRWPVGLPYSSLICNPRKGVRFHTPGEVLACLPDLIPQF